MTQMDDGLRHYRAALQTLALALREGRAMAEVMVFFAGQLRGDPPDLDGPPVTALPLPSAVLSALRNIDRARSDVDREWERLSDEAREALPSPDSLVEEG